MKNDRIAIIVRKLAGNRIVCQSNSQETDTILEDLKFEKKDGLFIRAIDNEDERISIIIVLIKNGALFSYGKDWSPAELISYYKEKGIITDKVKVISWMNPDKYIIREE